MISVVPAAEVAATPAAAFAGVTNEEFLVTLRKSNRVLHERQLYYRLVTERLNNNSQT